MEDNEIVDLYVNRKEEAISESDRKYGRYCYRIAYNILSNNEDSEECVNDTWIKTWNSIPQNRPTSLQFYLARITRNLSLDRHKEKTREKRGGGMETTSYDELGHITLTENGEDERVAAQLSADINRFLHNLPARECNIFLRRYFYSDTTPEIAERYGLKESNVLVILSRTRQKLREFLTVEGYTV